MSYVNIKTKPTKEFPDCCTNDVVKGDEVRFSEAVFSGIPYVSPTFLGVRTIEAVVVSESYSVKGRHTFTLDITKVNGVKALKIGKRIRRISRNLYKGGTYRKPWKDEAKRQDALDEKHVRRKAVRAGIREFVDSEKELYWWQCKFTRRWIEKRQNGRI